MTGKRKKKKSLQSAQQSAVDMDLPHPTQLVIVIDGKPQSLTEHMQEFTRRHYPNVGHASIMVPPLLFHQNWNLTDKAATANVQGQGDVFKSVRVTGTAEDVLRSSDAEYRVAECFRRLGNRVGGPNAIIVGHKYENYLNKVKQCLQGVPMPTDKVRRGEHDLLFISRSHGVLIVSIKSVGGNFDELNKSREDREKILAAKLQEAAKQLKGEVEVAEHVLSDLSPPVRAVLALPNIPRQLMTTVLSRQPEWKQTLDTVLKGDSLRVCGCSEEFPPLDRGGNSDRQLIEWFHQWVFPKADSPSAPALSQEQYEDVFGRYCGLCSTVEIPHHRTEGRIEIRTLPEAVAEANRRFRSLLLLPNQSSLLCNPYRRVYMYGMMGSGKSVMLTLKARHWLTNGCDVILVNVSYDASGCPIGHFLLHDINHGLDKYTNASQAALVNVRLSQLDKEIFLQDINFALAQVHQSGDVHQDTPQSSLTQTPHAAAASDPAVAETGRPVHFILDEVYPAFHPVFEFLLERYPESEIWAAGLEKDNCPPDFHAVEMEKVLRNPPSVQRILQDTDYGQNRRSKYTTSGAKEGLPTEGPAPRFIHHRNHTSLSSSSTTTTTTTTTTSSSSSNDPFSFLSSYSPLYCVECAMETLRIFKEVLGLPPEGSAGSAEEATASQGPSRGKKKCLSPNLSFRDVAVLCKDPERRRLYTKEGDVYKLNATLFEEFVTVVSRSVYVATLRAGSCPARVVQSATSGDLALPERDEVSVSWVNPASGLEWAVVVYVPGDPPLAPLGSPPESREPLADQPRGQESLTGQSEIQQSAASPQQPSRCADRSATTVLSSETRDVPSAPWETEDTTAVREESSQQKSAGAVTAHHARSRLDTPSDRSESPAEEAASGQSYREATSRAEKAEGNSGEPMEEEPGQRGIAQVSSGGALPVGAPDEVEAGMEEYRKRMSERDRKYLFWAAGRCTAQLVIIVP